MFDKLINTFFTSDFTILVQPGKVTVCKGRSGFASSFSTDRVLEYDYRSYEDMPEILHKVSKNLNPKPADRCFLGLPLKYFTLINFSLPAAAEENLDEAVKYSLMRHLPYDLEQARISYQLNEKGDFLGISAVIIPRETLKPFLKAAASMKITFYNVFPSLIYWSRMKGDGIYLSYGQGYGEALVYQNSRVTLQTWAAGKDDDPYFFEETSRLLANISDLPSTLYLWETPLSQGDIAEKLKIKPAEVKTIGFKTSSGHSPDSKKTDGYEINLLPRSVLRQRMFSTYMVYVGVIFFVLSLLAFPASKLAGQKRHLTKIENRLESISLRAEELNRIREESRQIMDSIETMGQMKQSYPSTIHILRELTEVIPETAWATSLNFSGNKITLQGEADSATSVIEAIENSAMFRDVRFSSPVTRSGPRDRFTLEAEVVL